MAANVIDLTKIDFTDPSRWVPDPNTPHGARVGYARRKNSQYQNNEDDLITIEERFDALTEKYKTLLKEVAVGTIKILGYKSYDEVIKDMVGMGEKEYYPISDCIINTVMQRDLDAEHVMDIVGEFTPGYVNPIRTYKDTHRKGRSVRKMFLQYICL